jgi:hypothetical protein
VISAGPFGYGFLLNAQPVSAVVSGKSIYALSRFLSTAHAAGSTGSQPPRETYPTRGSPSGANESPLDASMFMQPQRSGQQNNIYGSRIFNKKINTKKSFVVFRDPAKKRKNDDSRRDLRHSFGFNC